MSLEFVLSMADKLTGPARNMDNAMTKVVDKANVLAAAMKSAEAMATKASALGDTKKLAVAQGQYEKLSGALQLLEPELIKVDTEAKRVAEQTEHMATATKAANAAMKAAEGLRVAEAAKAAADAIAAATPKVSKYAHAYEELKHHIKSMIVLDPVEIFEKVSEFAIESAKMVGEVAVEFANMAIEASEAKEKLLASFSALAGGEEAGAETLAMIRNLEKAVPQNQATLGRWSNELLGAGVSLEDLQGNLKAVAGAQALVGGGDKVLGLLAKLNEAGEKGTKIKFNPMMLAGTGITEKELMAQLGMTPKQLELAKKQGTLTGKTIADALTNVLAEKGAGPVEAQTRGLAVQFDKLKDNVTRLFEDVDVGPFLEGMKSLFSIFDQGTESGKAMKGGIQGALNFVFKFLADGIPKVRHFFLEMIIWGLKAYIGIKQHFTLVKAIAAAALVGIVTFAVVGVVALAPLIVSFATLAIGVLAATWPIIAIGAAIGLVAFAFVMWGDKIWAFVKGAASALGDWVKGAADLAKNFVMGLVDGIKSGASYVLDAIRNLGSSMLDGIKGVLGIHSPSAEMMKLGIHTGTGFARGVEASNDNVASAAVGLSSAATSGTSSGRASPASSAGGTSVHVGSITIQIDGSKSPKQTGEAVLAELSMAFETFALTQGLGSGLGSAAA